MVRPQNFWRNLNCPSVPVWRVVLRKRIKHWQILHDWQKNWIWRVPWSGVSRKRPMGVSLENFPLFSVFITETYRKTVKKFENCEKLTENQKLFSCISSRSIKRIIIQRHCHLAKQHATSWQFHRIHSDRTHQTRIWAGKSPPWIAKFQRW